MMTSCCGAVVGNTHCASCHRNFRSTYAFDLHRRGWVKDEYPAYPQQLVGTGCLNPDDEMITTWPADRERLTLREGLWGTTQTLDLD